MPIRVGSGGASGPYGVQDFVDNSHNNHARVWPQQIGSAFTSDAGYMLCNDTSTHFHTGWRCRVPKDATNWKIAVWYTKTGSNNGSLTFRLNSDSPGYGTYSVSMTMTPQASLTLLEDTLAIDTSQTRDLIEMLANNGADGELRIWSVSLWPDALASIAAGISNEGFYGLDTSESAADSPLSTYLMRRFAGNAEVCYRTRPDTFLSLAEDTDIRTPATYAAWSTTSTSNVLVRIRRFRSGPGQTEIEWSALASNATGTGTLTMTTQYMLNAGIADEEVAFTALGAAPYDTEWVDDTAHATLKCAENREDALYIYLKASADRTYLWGLNAWFKEAST